MNNHTPHTLPQPAPPKPQDLDDLIFPWDEERPTISQR